MATIHLSDETQALLDVQLEKSGADPDKIVRLALELLSNPPVYDYDDLDEETKAAIEKSEAEYEQGLGVPLSQVAAELRALYPKNFGKR